jgi:hypothetical protein
MDVVKEILDTHEQGGLFGIIWARGLLEGLQFDTSLAIGLCVYLN